MIKLLSSKRIVEFEFFGHDTNELLIGYLDLFDIMDIYDGDNAEKDKNGNCYRVCVSSGCYLIKGNIREMVSFWNDFKRTHTQLILN